MPPQVPESTRRLIQSPEDIGAVLRTERKARKLTQADAAALAGVGTRTWNETERGTREQLGLGTALRMLQTLGLDVVIESRARRGASR